MPINKNDRHILATAVHSDAHIIVTQNLKDFPSDILSHYRVVAQSPDDFLVNLFYSDKEHMARILIRQAGSLSNPSMTILELLDRLQIHAPTFASLAREEFMQQNKELRAYILEVRSDIL